MAKEKMYTKFDKKNKLKKKQVIKKVHDSRMRFEIDIIHMTFDEVNST